MDYKKQLDELLAYFRDEANQAETAFKMFYNPPSLGIHCQWLSPVTDGETIAVNMLHTSMDGDHENDSVTRQEQKAEMSKLVINEKTCLQSLADSFTGLAMQARDENDDRPLWKIYIDYYVKKAAQENRRLLWQGDTEHAGPDFNLARMNGWLKRIEIDSVRLSGDGTASDFCYRMVRMIGDDNRKRDEKPTEYRIYTSDSNFRKILHHQDVKPTTHEPFKLSDYVTLVADPGLNGTDCLVGVQDRNLSVLCDLMSRDENGKYNDRMTVEFDDKRDDIDTHVQYTLGTAIWEPGEIYFWKTKTND